MAPASPCDEHHPPWPWCPLDPQDGAESPILTGPQLLPAGQGVVGTQDTYPLSYTMVLQGQKQIAQDSYVHGGVATCMASQGPSCHPQALIEQQVQGPAFPGGHQRGFWIRREKRSPWKTFLVTAVPLFSQPVATLVALTPSKTLMTYCVPGTVLALGIKQCRARPIPTPRTSGGTWGRKLLKF